MDDSELGHTAFTRRQYLKYTATIGLVGTAGCSGDGSPGTTVAEETQPPTESPTPSPTSEPTASPTPTERPAEESCAATEPALPSSEEEWWPMFQHDTRNSGYNPATMGPTKEVGSAWAVETGGKVRSSPAVDADTVYVGSNDGNLYALDLITGKEVWSFETGGPIESSPAVVDGLVYVGSHDHNVYAVDAATGERHWAFETGGPVRSSPTVAKNLLDVSKPAWRDHGILAIGSDDGFLYILDGLTGEEKRTITTDGPVVSTPWIAPYATDAGQYLWVQAGSTDGAHYGVNPTVRGGADDGEYERTYEYEFDSPIYSSITVNSDPFDTGGPEIFGADDGILRYRSEGGFHEEWDFQTGGKIRASPALADGNVYVGSWDGNVYALAAERGDQRWVFETGHKIESSAAVVGDAVYFGSADHHVYALGRQSGDKLWDFRTGGPVHSSPAVMNGTVFIGSDDGHVYALTACQ